MIRIQLNIPIYTEDEAFNLMPREQKDFDVKTNLIIAAIAGALLDIDMESFVTIAGAVSENVQRICGRTIGNEKMEEIAGRFAKGESIDSIYEEIIAGQ